MKLNVKKIGKALSGAAMALAMFPMNVMASTTSAASEEGGSGIPTTGFTGVVAPIIELLDQILWPLISVVGAVGALYCVVLGVKFAKAEEPQEREKAKSHLKNAIIGFILIFVLMVVLKLLMPAMVRWVSKYPAAA